ARRAGPQQLQHVVEGQARVHDVLDDQEVAAIEALRKVLDELDLARGLRGRSVGRDRDVVEGERQVDGAREVGEERAGALQDADEVRLLAGVVGGDLRAHLGHARLDLFVGKQYPHAAASSAGRDYRGAWTRPPRRARCPPHWTWRGAYPKSTVLFPPRGRLYG